jgi:hypothetical protein
MKTRTQLNLNVLILNLYYCNYIYTTLEEKNLQHSVYCPSGVLGADPLGAETFGTALEMPRDAGIAAKICR